MAKRVSLSERRAKDSSRGGGVDALFAAPAPTVDNVSVSPKLVKATYYVRPEQVLAIESIQLAERQKSGKRRDKSELVQEALDLLIKKYGQ